MSLEGMVPNQITQQTELDDLAKLIGSDKDVIKLNNIFEKMFGRFIDRLNRISDKFETDYHIVIINEYRQKRYSIIEGTNPTFADKPKDYGIVGSLISQGLEKYQAIYVQFRATKHNTIIAYTEHENGKIKKIPHKVANSLLGGTLPTWEPEKESKFAIATVLLKDRTENIIGACSIDFDLKSNKEYPDFAFRENEIQEIFDTLYCIKTVFEALQTRQANTLVTNVIKKIREAKI